jgi:hypothetical protein
MVNASNKASSSNVAPNPITWGNEVAGPEWATPWSPYSNKHNKEFLNIEFLKLEYYLPYFLFWS